MALQAARLEWVEFVWPHHIDHNVILYGEWDEFQGVLMAKEETSKHVIGTALVSMLPGEYRYYFEADGRRYVSKKHLCLKYQGEWFNVRIVKQSRGAAVGGGALENELKETARGLDEMEVSNLEKSQPAAPVKSKVKKRKVKTPLRKRRSFADLAVNSYTQIAKERDRETEEPTVVLKPLCTTSSEQASHGLSSVPQRATSSRDIQTKDAPESAVSRKSSTDLTRKLVAPKSAVSRKSSTDLTRKLVADLSREPSGDVTRKASGDLPRMSMDAREQVRRTHGEASTARQRAKSEPREAFVHAGAKKQESSPPFSAVKASAATLVGSHAGSTRPQAKETPKQVNLEATTETNPEKGWMSRGRHTATKRAAGEAVISTVTALELGARQEPPASKGISRRMDPSFGQASQWTTEASVQTPVAAPASRLEQAEAPWMASRMSREFSGPQTVRAQLTSRAAPPSDHSKPASTCDALVRRTTLPAKPVYSQQYNTRVGRAPSGDRPRSRPVPNRAVKRPVVVTESEAAEAFPSGFVRNTSLDHARSTDKVAGIRDQKDSDRESAPALGAQKAKNGKSTLWWSFHDGRSREKLRLERHNDLRKSRAIGERNVGRMFPMRRWRSTPWLHAMPRSDAEPGSYSNASDAIPPFIAGLS